MIKSLQLEICTIPYSPEDRARMMGLKLKPEARSGSSRPAGKRHDS